MHRSIFVSMLSKLANISPRYRWLLIVSIHLFLSVVSNLGAFLLHFDGVIPSKYWPMIGFVLLSLLPVRMALLYFMGVFRGLWRYTSIRDLEQIVVGIVMSSIVGAFLIYPIFSIYSYPYSVLIIDTILLIMLVVGVRVTVRVLRGRDFSDRSEQKRVLIYGAGDGGELLLRDMMKNSDLNYAALGFIDDDPNKRGLKIHGVPVLGSQKDLGSLVSRLEPQEIIIAIPSARLSQIGPIMEECQRFQIPLKTLPSLKNMIGADISVRQIRDVSLEDLLFREPVQVNLENIKELLCGKRVLVTGAAGSIGSEISRQILRYGPERVLLYDRSENDLYSLDVELHRAGLQNSYRIVVGDVGDSEHLRIEFQRLQPQIVFHAAAYKHVPLMEQNIAESIKNNVATARILMELADQFGVETFVQISTDKAVNPTSVMGASKRIAEMLAKYMNGKSKTTFVVVRFGNVLGSNGSVVPLFKEQIRRGGPVTVTHPEIQRYFMTIPEAVQLVLQAASMGKGEEVFVLDMGEQVKVIELAKTMITLSGLTPDKDIAIEITGLRPGEKLYEELYGSDEIVKETFHKKIFAAVDSNNNRTFNSQFIAQIQTLERMAQEGSTEEIIRKMKEFIPTFQWDARGVAYRGGPPIPLSRHGDGLTPIPRELVKF